MVLASEGGKEMTVKTDVNNSSNWGMNLPQTITIVKYLVVYERYCFLAYCKI